MLSYLETKIRKVQVQLEQKLAWDVRERVYRYANYKGKLKIYMGILMHCDREEGVDNLMTNAAGNI